MKRLFMAFAAALLTIPAWAGDLKPVSTDEAIKEYQSFWASKDIDPTNHVVWKLYIRKSLIPKSNYNHEAEYYSAVLTMTPKPRYVVVISINQLYNFLQPVPKVGDVIAVEGRVTNHIVSTVQGPMKTRQVKSLILYLENAEKLPNELISVSAVSGPEQGEDSGSVPNLPVTTGSVPAITPTVAVSAPSSSVAPITATPGFFKGGPATPVH